MIIGTVVYQENGKVGILSTHIEVDWNRSQHRKEYADEVEEVDNFVEWMYQHRCIVLVEASYYEAYRQGNKAVWERLVQYCTNNWLERHMA